MYIVCVYVCTYMYVCLYACMYVCIYKKMMEQERMISYNINASDSSVPICKTTHSFTTSRNFPVLSPFSLIPLVIFYTLKSGEKINRN